MDTEDPVEAILAIQENEAYLDLFEHPGMRLLMDRVMLLRNAYNRISSVKTMEEFHMNQGRMDILNWLISWPELCKEALEQNKE
jgi:tRNA-dihydrouridine synthase